MLVTYGNVISCRALSLSVYRQDKRVAELAAEVCGLEGGHNACSVSVCESHRSLDPDLQICRFVLCSIQLSARRLSSVLPAALCES